MEYDLSMQNVTGTLFWYKNDLWVSLFFLLFRLNFWWKISFLWRSLITFAVFCFYPLSNFIPCFSPAYTTPGLFSLPWWWELGIYFLASFLACFSSCLLACFVHHIVFAVFFKSGPCVFSQLEANSSHCWVSQFPAPLVPCAAAMVCSQLVPCGSREQTFSSLGFHFVWLCVFVLSTAINTAAVLKAGSVFWQADLAPTINSTFLKKS